MGARFSTRRLTLDLHKCSKATAEQCFRFLDSQLDFEDREVSLLLRALQGSPCDKRAEFSNQFARVQTPSQDSMGLSASRQGSHDAG